jgi:hypothetical protein
MAKLYRVAFIALCICSLFSVLAWADGGTASNPVVGPDVPLFIPAPQNKLPPPGSCWYPCVGGRTTAVNGDSSDWGMGSTCAEAQAAFSSAVRSKAQNDCDSTGDFGWCNLTEVTGGCFFNGTMFQIDGYANYGCRVQFCEE